MAKTKNRVDPSGEEGDAGAEKSSSSSDKEKIQEATEKLKSLARSRMVKKKGLPKHLEGKGFKKGEKRTIAAASKSGKTMTVKKHAALINNTPWLKDKLTVEQRHFIALLRDNKFSTLVRDILTFIATKAETAEDYHKLLNQILKLPFVQKAYNDIEDRRKRDIIPIMIEVMRENDCAWLISKLQERLEREGWWEDATTDAPTVPLRQVRPDEDEEESS